MQYCSLLAGLCFTLFKEVLFQIRYFCQLNVPPESPEENHPNKRPHDDVGQDTYELGFIQTLAKFC